MNNNVICFLPSVCPLQFLHWFCSISNWTVCFYYWVFRVFKNIFLMVVFCQIRFVNILYWSIVCLFIFNSVFLKAKVLNFSNIQFINFPIVGSAFGINMYIYFLSSYRSWCFSPIVFSNFIVLYFTFKFMIHFEFTFYKAGVYLFILFFLCISNFSQHHFLRDLTFNFFITFKIKNQLYILLGSISRLFHAAVFYVLIIPPVPHNFVCCSCIMSWNWVDWFLSFYFIFPNYFNKFNSFCFL